jgi:exopolysaccharide biosynthesis polyprenyl glycosylphosphotransferase
MKSNQSTHFEISERKVLLKVFDVALVWLALYFHTKTFSFSYFNLNFNFISWIWLITLGFYIILFGTVFEIYNLQKAESKKATVRNVTLTSLLVTFFFLLTPILSPSLPGNRFQIFYLFIILVSTLLIWRFFYIGLIASPRFFKRVLIVGDQFDIDKIGSDLLRNDPNYEIKGFVSLVKCHSLKFKSFPLKDLKKTVKDQSINEIVVASSYKGLSSELYQSLVPLLKIGFPIKAYAHVYEEITSKVHINHINNDFYFYFPFSRSNQNRLYFLYRRTVDLITSSIGLIVGIIILPLILLGNLLANRGRLFYKQLRLGRSGKEFYIIKFRTMINNAEKNGAQLATKRDKRITKFGNFLRRTRLDEIPQFYNILIGDMTLIGPRPERPEFLERLYKKFPFYEVRQVIMPGLTGWAQVNARYAGSDEDMIEKLQYDLYYIKHRSVFLDLRIMMKTISTIIFFRGQ